MVTPSHGGLLAKLPDEKTVESMVQRIAKKKLSIPTIEKWVKSSEGFEKINTRVLKVELKTA